MQHNHQFQGLYGTLVPSQPAYHLPVLRRRQGPLRYILRCVRAAAGLALDRLRVCLAQSITVDSVKSIHDTNN